MGLWRRCFICSSKARPYDADSMPIAVVPEGFGLACGCSATSSERRRTDQFVVDAVNNQSIRWTITCINGKAEQLRHHLRESATEIREVMALGAKEAGAPGADVKPKL